jgi:hypothetical protein
MYGKGTVIGGLNARRGTIIDSEVREDEFTAAAEVALNDMFGYSSALQCGDQNDDILLKQFGIILAGQAVYCNSE